MSYLKKQMGFLKFDKRLLEINLKSGTITQVEYDQHLADLADDEAKSEKLSLDPEKDAAAATTPEDMNGGQHTTAPEAAVNPFGQAETVTTTTTPTNNDPFGSGY